MGRAQEEGVKFSNRQYDAHAKGNTFLLHLDIKAFRECTFIKRHIEGRVILSTS